MILPYLTIFDLATVRANFIKPIDMDAVKTKSKDFALLVPIFNSTKYLTNIEFLKKYADRVVLCTTTNEEESFINELKLLSSKYGFRISYSEVGSGKKNPWAIYNKTLLAHDAVLKDTISELKEKYVIFIDGDTYVDGDLETLCGAMIEHGFDLSSVKILPSQRKTVMENLQGVEYDIAMQARLIYPWLTSGAGMVAKREVMMEIMKNHSLFFNGGDIEIGKLADMMGYRVGHLPMTFYTDVPSNFRAWAKQRFSWMCGCFRHAIVNVRHNLNYPFHFLYFSFVIYFLFPFKVWEMLHHIVLLPLLIGLYAAITYIANWKVRSKWMLIFPFYALFQVLVLLWMGIYRYIVTVYKSKNFGIIRIKHRPNKRHLPSEFVKKSKNYLTVSAALALILVTTSGTVQQYLFGRQYETIEFVQLGAAAAYNAIPHNPPKQGQVAGASTEAPARLATVEMMQEPLHNTIQNPRYFVVPVNIGDGKTQLARKAIEQYLSLLNVQITRRQRIYAEDLLQQSFEFNTPLYSDGARVNVEFRQTADAVLASTEY